MWLSPFGLVCLKVGGPYFVGALSPGTLGTVDKPALGIIMFVRLPSCDLESKIRSKSVKN